MHQALRKHFALEPGVYDASGELHSVMKSAIGGLKAHFSKDSYQAMGLLGALQKGLNLHAQTAAAHRAQHEKFHALASGVLQSLADHAHIDLGEFAGREEAGPHAGGSSRGGAPAGEGTAFPGERSAGFKPEADKAVKALSHGRITVDAQGQERIAGYSEPVRKVVDSAGTERSVTTEGATAQDIEALKKSIPLDVRPAPRSVPLDAEQADKLRKDGYKQVIDRNTQGLRPNERRAVLDRLGDAARGEKVRKTLLG